MYIVSSNVYIKHNQRLSKKLSVSDHLVGKYSRMKSNKFLSLRYELSANYKLANSLVGATNQMLE